ncbi:gluconate 2-dehydrogenase subunit 3 family protein [Pseudomonas typographi]|uniref:gluconate 2-dehydrogenase subunit 3 family protein n=1 Tax=Pseudomonas typographi TaxID=2715964 RepID=UPI0016829E52|nr:gluconate 2-dehydrogenase subunit 3 family protein [Pseudomonas typographi]MBD1551921.1 gluconate 2-dehydrogenase subunit 3 family protein [Pseudomonas typographi]
MSVDRRTFIKAAPAGIAVLITSSAVAPAAADEQQGAPQALAYTYLRPSEGAFVERLADHMVPADALSPSGNELGIPVYIDRALSSGWGKGERVYLQGPFLEGTPNQGYQLALTPARLFRLGTEATLQYAQQTYGKRFNQLAPEDLDDLLHRLKDGRAELTSDVPSEEYFNLLYALVREGLFADPAYGGNRNKAGWRMLDFPGVIESNKRNIARYRNRPYRVEPISIADVSGWTGQP